MREWWTYRLSDLLLFTRQTYFRLFELYNNQVWPLQLLALAVACIGIGLVFRRARYQNQLITVLLVVMWLWVGWAYHLQRYSSINWAAGAFAGLFFLEALFLAAAGLVRKRLGFSRPQGAAGWLGIGMCVYALVLHPLLAPVLHGKWRQAEVVGIAPDPTAIFTLGLLLLISAGNRLLFVIPLLWCAISAAVLFAMPSAQASVPAAAVALSVLGVVANAKRRAGISGQ